MIIFYNLISWRLASPKLCNCTGKFGTNWRSMGLQVLSFCKILRKNFFPQDPLPFRYLVLIGQIYGLSLYYSSGCCCHRFGCEPFQKAILWPLRLYADTTALPLLKLVPLFFPFKYLYFPTKGLNTSPCPTYLSNAWGGAWRELSCSSAAYLSAVFVSSEVLFKVDSVWVILANDSSMFVLKIPTTLFDWSTLSLGELEDTGKNDNWSCGIWVWPKSHFLSETLFLLKTS